MGKFLKLTYFLFLMGMCALVLIGALFLYPWDNLHGGVATCGPLHMETDRINGSLLSGFKVSNLRVRWADLWELETKELSIRLQPSGFFTGRVFVTGLMSGYTWKALDDGASIPGLSDELKRRLGWLHLKLRCVDGRVLCLVGPDMQRRVFTVRSVRMTFSERELRMAGNVLAAGGVPGDFRAKVRLDGHLDLELTAKELTVKEVLRLFAVAAPWVKNCARGSGECDLVWALSGPPRNRKTAGRLVWRKFTGSLGRSLEVHRMSGTAHFLPGRSLLKNITGRFNGIHVDDGEGILFKEAGIWTLRGRGGLGPHGPDESWSLSGKPELTLQIIPNGPGNNNQVAMKFSFAGENFTIGTAVLQNLWGTVALDDTGTTTESLACRFLGVEASLSISGGREKPLDWTLTVPRFPAGYCAELTEIGRSRDFFYALDGVVVMTVRGSYENSRISSYVDVMIPEPITYQNSGFSFGPGLINITRGKVEARNLAVSLSPYPRCSLSSNIFATALPDDGNRKWIISPSPYELTLPGKSAGLRGLLAGDGSLVNNRLLVNGLEFSLPGEGKIFIRPFVIESGVDLVLEADIENLPLASLQSFFPSGLSISGAVSGNFRLDSRFSLLEGEVMLPRGVVELPSPKKEWKRWEVAPLFLSLSLKKGESEVSKHSISTEIMAEETWGSFIMQANRSGQQWWTGKGKLILAREKAGDLKLNNIAPIFKGEDGSVHLPLRLDGGLEVPDLSVNIGQEVGRALVRKPGQLLKSLQLTP